MSILASIEKRTFKGYIRLLMQLLHWQQIQSATSCVQGAAWSAVISQR